MFKLVESEKEIKKVRTFCARGYFGARINTTLAAYGTDDRFVRTWYEEADGRLLAVMQMTEGAAVVKCKPGTDFVSLAMLIQFAGAKTVIGDRDSVGALPFCVSSQGFLMECRDLPDLTCKAYSVDAEQIASIYPVLFGEDAAEKDKRAFAVWFSDISHRVRHGFCECFAIYENDIAVSCASVLYSNAQYGCIGAVATVPGCRNRGFGRDCTLAAAQSVLERGQSACLACVDSGIHQWYEAMGFSVCGEWAEALI